MTTSRQIAARCQTPACGVKFTVKTRQAEKAVACPKCGDIQVVRRAEDTTSAPATAKNLPVVVARVEQPADQSRPVKLPTVKRTEAKPWGLTAEVIEQVLRPIATTHRVKGILKQLDGVNAKKVKKAVGGYARLMENDEIPLVLVDSSFLQDGSAGFLLTTRRLYSSLLPAPIELDEITSVAVEKPTELQGLMLGLAGPVVALLYRACGGKPLTTRLRVNGHEVFAGRCNHAFWIEALLALGDEVRRAEGTDMLARKLQRRGALAQHVAAAIAARMDATQVSKCFSEVAPAEEVRRLDDEMRQIYGHMQWVKSGVVTAIGFFILAIAALITLETSWTWYWIGGMVAGLGLFSIGVYRLTFGPPPMPFDTLHAKWKAKSP